MKKRRILYIIFIILLVVLANISMYFYLYFDNIRLTTTHTNILLLNEKSSITYNIESKDNNYYNSNNTSNYDVNDISRVDTFYNYSVNFDKTVEGEYSYYVRGVLFDNTTEVKEVFKSTEYKYILDDKNVINITHINNIDLKNVIASNKEISELDDAVLKYELVVDYHIFNKEINKYVSHSKSIEIDIPVTSGKNIVISPNETKNSKEYSNEISNNDVTYLIICLEFLGSVLLYILCIAYLIERISPKEYLNDTELEYIRNKYKKYIIKINFIPDLTYKEVVFVDDIESLVDYAKKLNLPIDYIDIIKHKEAIFAVMYDNYAYIYKVSVKKRK
jgi:hypothetical protein